jgi:hypothetical protein
MRNATANENGNFQVIDPQKRISAAMQASAKMLPVSTAIAGRKPVEWRKFGRSGVSHRRFAQHPGRSLKARRFYDVERRTCAAGSNPSEAKLQLIESLSHSRADPLPSSPRQLFGPCPARPFWRDLSIRMRWLAYNVQTSRGFCHDRSF